MQITMEVSARRIADLMVGAFECNSMTNSWVAAVRLRKPAADDIPHTGKNTVWYDKPELWAGEFEIDLWEISDESEYEGGFDPEADPDIDLAELAELGLTKRTFTRADLEQGIALMAKDHASHFGDWVQENDDAITADVLLQCVVLKDVVYG
jgi:hypothetical protein